MALGWRRAPSASLPARPRRPRRPPRPKVPDPAGDSSRNIYVPMCFVFRLHKSVYVCIYIYINVNIFTYTYTYIHIYIYTYMLRAPPRTPNGSDIGLWILSLVDFLSLFLQCLIYKCSHIQWILSTIHLKHETMRSNQEIIFKTCGLGFVANSSIVPMVSHV